MVHPVGTKASRTRKIEARDIELFTEISGDRNPLHYDEAAATARQALLEASATYRSGSNTSMSTTMIPVAGSRWQEEFGIHDDTPDRFFDDIMTKSKGSADQLVARALVDAGRDLSEFLATDCEIPLELLTDAEFTAEKHRIIGL